MAELDPRTGIPRNAILTAPPKKPESGQSRDLRQVAPLQSAGLSGLSAPRKGVEEVVGTDLGNIVYGFGQSSGKLGYAFYGDAKSTFTGKPTFSRTWNEVGQILPALKKQGKKIVLHPVREFEEAPISTALFGYSVISGGRTGVRKGVQVVKEVRGQGTVLSAADRSAAGLLLNHAQQGMEIPPRLVTRTTREAATRLAKPSKQLQALIDSNPALGDATAAVLGRIKSGELEVHSGPLNVFGSGVRTAGATRGGRIVKAAVKNPVPKERLLTVPYDANRPLFNGDMVVGGTLDKPTRIMGIVTKPGGILVARFLGREEIPLSDLALADTSPVIISRVPSKNALTRDIQGLKDWYDQRRIDAVAGRNQTLAGSGVPEVAGKASGFVYAHQPFGVNNIIGGELRGARQIRNKIDVAPVDTLQSYGQTTPAKVLGFIGRDVPAIRSVVGIKTRRLSAAELAAADVVSAGTHADGVQAAAIHVAQERRAISEIGRLKGELDNLISAGDEAAARAVAVELGKWGRKSSHEKKLALWTAASEHLANPSQKLLDAIEKSRQISNRTAGPNYKDLPEDMAMARLGARSDTIKANGTGAESLLDERTRINSYQYAAGLISDADQAIHDVSRSGRQRVTIAVKANSAAIAVEEKAKNAYFRVATSRTPGENAVLKEINVVFKKVSAAYTKRANNRSIVDKATRAEGIVRRQRVIVAHMAEGREKGLVSDGDLGRAQDRLVRLEKEYEEFASRLHDFREGQAEGARLAADQERLGELLRTHEGSATEAVRKAELDWQRAFVERGKTQHPIDVARQELADAKAKIYDDLEAQLGARATRSAEIQQSLIAEGERVVENGGFFVPAKRGMDIRNLSSPGGKLPGPTGLSLANPVSRIVKRGYTGASERLGNMRTDVTALVADDARAAQRFRNVGIGIDDVLKMSSATRTEAGKYAVAIRDKIPDKFKEALERVDAGPLTQTDLVTLSPTTLADYLHQMFPDNLPSHNQDGSVFGAEPVPGLRWIDPGRLGGLMAEAGGKGLGWQVVRAINAPIKAMAFFLAPKYAWNAVQSMITISMQQGLFVPVNLKALAELSPETRHLVFSTVGEGLSQSISGTRGKTPGVQQLANAWSLVTDKYQRGSAFMHEARRYGYVDDGQIHYLLTSDDPAVIRQRDIVIRKANRESIAYGELKSWERMFSEGLIIYPWMRASFLYAIRFPGEHPFQAALYSQMGEYGHDEMVRRFGPFVGSDPAYRGLVYLDEGEDPQHPIVSNLTALSNFTSPSEIIDMFGGLFKGRSPHAGDLANALGPVYGAGGALIGGGYQKPGQSWAQNALDELLGPALPYSLYKKLTRPQNTQPDALHQPVYPTDRRSAIESSLFGRIPPGPINLPAMQARDEAAYLSSLPADKRASYRNDRDRKSAIALFNRIGRFDLVDRAPRAYRMKEALDQALLKEKRRLGHDPRGKERSVAYVIALVDEGVFSESFAEDLRTQIRLLSEAKAQKKVMDLWRANADPKVLSIVKSIRRQLVGGTGG